MRLQLKQQQLNGNQIMKHQLNNMHSMQMNEMRSDHIETMDLHQQIQLHWTYSTMRKHSTSELRNQQIQLQRTDSNTGTRKHSTSERGNFNLHDKRSHRRHIEYEAQAARLEPTPT